MESDLTGGFHKKFWTLILPPTMERQMKKKIKVFFLFFLLSVTPFIRGCGETWGFPFPALGPILNTDVISERINNLIANLKSCETLIYILVNFLIACLLAHSVLRDEKHQRWTSSFLTSLAIHLSATWLMVFLVFIDFKQPFLKKSCEFYGTVYGDYLLDIPIKVANNLKDTLNIECIDIMARAYFISVTALVGGVIYLLKLAKRLSGKQRIK
jgi:hypothetical protein